MIKRQTILRSLLMIRWSCLSSIEAIMLMNRRSNIDSLSSPPPPCAQGPDLVFSRDYIPSRNWNSAAYNKIKAAQTSHLSDWK